MMGFRRWIVCGGALGKQKRACLTALYVVNFFFNFLFYDISVSKLGSKVTLSRQKEQIWVKYNFFKWQIFNLFGSIKRMSAREVHTLVNLIWITAVPAKNHILCDFIWKYLLIVLVQSWLIWVFHLAEVHIWVLWWFWSSDEVGSWLGILRKGF